MDIGAWLANMGGGGGGGAASTAGATKDPAKAAEDAAGSHFPHIHAANALAAAVSAGDGDGKASRLKLEGRFLAAESVVDVDAPRSGGESQPQLQVSPITVMKTDYRLQMMHQIAVNTTYICYGLKQGPIRALNKNTAGRVLFKDHASMVIDMRFFSASSNVLASIDQSGDVIVRKVFEDGEGEDAAPIQQELLVRHQLLPAPAATRRLAWHPQLENVLAVATQDRVSLVNVPPTSGVAGSAEFLAPSLPAGIMTDGAITTLAFCDRGDMLAVADDKGFVYVWALDSDLLSGWEAGGAPLEPLPVEADVKFRAFEDGQYAAALDFLPSQPGEAAQDGKELSQAVLLVGDSTCRVLRLWSVDVEAKPQRSSSLELVSSTAGNDAFFNHMLLQPNFNAVVLANTKHKQVYVAHFKWDAHGNAAFDHLADFAVTQPILSMTTTTESCFEDGSEVFHLYTVQTEGIQQYTLFPESCLPDKEAEGVGSSPVADADAGTASVARASEPLASPTVPQSVHLMTPAEVLNSGWMAPAAQQPADSTRTQQPQQPLHRASSNVSDAASPYRPQDIQEPVPPKAADAAPLLNLLQGQAAAARGAGPVSVPLQGVPSSSSVHSDHGSSGFPASTTAALARSSEVEAVGVASAAALGAEPDAMTSPVGADRPLPPQPTALVKKLSAASPTLLAGVGLPRGSTGPPTPAAPPVSAATSEGPPSRADLGWVDGNAGDGAALAAAAAASALQGTGAISDAAAAGGSELSRVLALQQQLLSQLAFTQRETIKQMRSELAKASKASETATVKAVEAALKAHAKQAAEERAKEVKKEREELAKLLQASTAGVVKEVSSRVQDASRATVSAISTSVAGAVSKALSDTLPAALATGATQQALEQALSSQLRSALPRALSDNFSSSIIPAFERATQTMFSQIDATLSAGLADHLAASKTSNVEVGAAVREATAQLEAAVKQLGIAAAAVHTAVAGAGAGAAGTPADAAAAAASGSGASKAISLAELEAQRDPRSAITTKLAMRDYQAAFTTALNANNVDTTMWLCKQLSPGQVFDQDPCPLSQEVLLSLVTHLAYQIQQADTEVKLSWLVEASPAIDPRNPKIAEHCRRVLEPVKTSLTQVARSLSGEPGRLAKTAVHLINSLLHQ